MDVQQRSDILSDRNAKFPCGRFNNPGEFLGKLILRFIAKRGAAAAAPGAVCRGGDRRSGPVGDGQELSGHGLGLLPSGAAAGPAGLRLCDRGVFEPQAGAGDLRFGGVPLHCRQRSSRPRHHRDVSAALSQGDRSAVRAGAGTGARDGPAQDGHGGAGRHQDPRQCQPAQRAVL